ncbi:MAG: GNAT family N-acetyltransferase [Candidatus Latescibacterota bacterium]
MEVSQERQEHGWRVEIHDGGCSLSRCLVVDVEMRVGRAVLRVGGIGAVGTLPQWRGRGLARRVMECAVELMQREWYDVSLLHGIQDFYHRFGYVTCMPEHEFSVDVRDAERAPRGSARVRRMRPADRQAVLAIYARDNALRTGSAVRPAQGWSGFPRGTWWTYRALPYVVLDGRGAVQGYVVCNDV